MNVIKLWHHFCDWLLHRTIFHSKAGDIDFYGIQEDDPVETDGMVVVVHRTTNTRMAYAFRFENRYMVHRPVGNRVMAVFQALYRMDRVRPLAMIEDNQVYTPFGHYDRIPKDWRDLFLPT